MESGLILVPHQVDWVNGEENVSTVRLGLCCSRPADLRPGPARSSLKNAIQFFRVSQDEDPGEVVAMAQLDSSPADLEGGIRQAVERDVTHMLFLSPGAILPFYSLEVLLGMRERAVSGVSFSIQAGTAGEAPEIFPRLGFFDPEGRAYPYFGWSAPNIFQVDWCGLDCLLLARDALEEIAGPLARLRSLPPALRISQALRTRGIPILIDSCIECPQLTLIPGPEGGVTGTMLPGPAAWREFSRDCPDRRIPRGPLFDPAYRGRAWYREWVERCLLGS
jgi:hypothetical protein